MSDHNDIESLAALMREDETTALLEVDPRRIDRDEDQPRHTFDPDELNALAESIRAQGIIQPLVVSLHPSNPDRYLLVAGERRLRAAIQAELAAVPIIVRTFGAAQRLAIQLIENLDRSPLDIIEEAQAVVRLLGAHSKTAREVAEMLGKSQSWVSIRRKIGEHVEVVDVFVSGGKTTDPETLSMLVDLERMRPEAYGKFMFADRVSRAEVRSALDVAKHITTGLPPRPDPALTSIVPPMVTPPAPLEVADEPAEAGDPLPGLADTNVIPSLPTHGGQPDDDDEVLFPSSVFGNTGNGPTHAPHSEGATTPRVTPDANNDDDDRDPAPEPTLKPGAKRPNVRDPAPPPADRQRPLSPPLRMTATDACQRAEKLIAKGWNLKVRAVLTGKDDEGELRISFRDLSDLKNLTDCLGCAD